MDPRLSTPPRPALGAVIGAKRNCCPFGCERVDEHGYCRHLVGFTVDGKTVELRELIPGHESYERVGRLVRPVERGDRAVATNSPTLRVYRADGKAPVRAAADDPRARKETKWDDDAPADPADPADPAEMDDEALERATAPDAPAVTIPTNVFN